MRRAPEHAGHGVGGVADGGELHPAPGRLAPVEGPQGTEPEGEVAGAEAPHGHLHPGVGGGVADPAPAGGAGGDDEHGADDDAHDGQDANDLAMIHGGLFYPLGGGRWPRGRRRNGCARAATVVRRAGRGAPEVGNGSEGC